MMGTFWTKYMIQYLSGDPDLGKDEKKNRNLISSLYLATYGKIKVFFTTPSCLGQQMIEGMIMYTAYCSVQA